MKNYLWILYILFSLGILISCSSDDDVQENGDVEPLILRATIEPMGSESRAGLSKYDGQMLWSSFDEMAVTLQNKGNFSAQGRFSLNGSGGQSNGIFQEMEVSGFELGAYAAYPYRAVKMDAANLIYTFPEKYTYDYVDEMIPQNGLSVVSTPWLLPLAGVVKEGQTVLHHLGGVMCIDIEHMPCKAGVFTFSTDKRITGDYSLALTELNNNKAQFTLDGAADNSEVEIAFSYAKLDAHGVFYIPLPVGDYCQFTVQVYAYAEDGGLKEVLKNVTKRTFSVHRKELVKFDIINISSGD